MTDLTFGAKYVFTNAENGPESETPDPDNGSVVTLQPLSGLYALMAAIVPDGAPVGLAVDDEGDEMPVWADDLTPVEEN